MLAQSVPEKFVAGSLDVSATTLRHCLQLADEFETFVRHVDGLMRKAHDDHCRCEQLRARDAGEIARLKKTTMRKNPPLQTGFSEEEQKVYDEAVAAGRVERIENGEWPDRNLFNPFPRRR